jgi:hypothetical protein
MDIDDQRLLSEELLKVLIGELDRARGTASLLERVEILRGLSVNRKLLADIRDAALYEYKRATSASTQAIGDEIRADSVAPLHVNTLSAMIRNGETLYKIHVPLDDE